MFAEALSKVKEFTRPVIISKHLANGSVQSGCGSFIVVNRDGWIVTAAHIIVDIYLSVQHQAEKKDCDEKRKAVNDNTALNAKQKRKMLKKIKMNPEWVMDQAVLWGVGTTGNLQIVDCSVDVFTDVAIGKLEPFDPQWLNQYPIFKNPAEDMPEGTSLCRLGFPFHRIDATFNPTDQSFSLGPGVLPVPRFPNDGILTRFIKVSSQDGKREAQLIETSTPGLRGQSGGPIFDSQGNVWAMQSRTQSLPLGFSPTVQQGNVKIVEHQFMHVGWGVHVLEIIRMLQNHGVNFTLSS